MPYAIVWSDTTPAGSEFANQTAPYFRNTKQAIQERMNDVLVNDFTADPLVIQARILGNVNPKYLNIHPSAGVWAGPLSVGWNDQPSGNYIQVTNPAPGSGNQFGYFPLDIPPGVTITDFAILGSGDGSLTTSYSLYKVSILNSATPNVPVLIKSVSFSGSFGGWDAGGVAELVDPNYMYYIVANVAVRFSFSSVLQGIQVIYSTPDCRSTR